MELLLEQAQSENLHNRTFMSIEETQWVVATPTPNLDKHDASKMTAVKKRHITLFGSTRKTKTNKAGGILVF